MKNNIEQKKNWLDFYKENIGRNPTNKELKILMKLGVTPEFDKNDEKGKAIVEILKDNKKSWYTEQKKRNTGRQEVVVNKVKKVQDVGTLPGMYYRGKVISKYEMFERADKLAHTLRVEGVKKGDKIPVCISNVPDLAIILLASSKIGAIPNFFAPSFEKDYIKEIVNFCDTDFVFTTDNLFEELFSKIEGTKIKREVVISLADDLPQKFPEYYKNVPEEYYRFENKIPILKEKYNKEGNEVLTLTEFHDLKYKAVDQIHSVEDVRHILDADIEDENPSIFDIATITYSSGTTNTSKPKPIAHNVLSYFLTMRFHDKDLSGLPEERNVICLDLIPSTSDTAIKSVISDNLSRIIAFEPIYSKESFIYSLIMNRPDFVDATTSFWVEMAKQIVTDPKFKKIDLSFLGLPLAVGEATTENERAFIDKIFRETGAGRASIKKLLGLPINTFLGVGGGRCESGGMFYTVLKRLMELKNTQKLQYRDIGMETAPYAIVSILDENKKKLSLNQIGELTETSFCDAVGYLYPQTGLTDITPNFGCYAYQNELGNVIMLGRMGNEFILEDGTKVPEFLLSKIVEIDKKRILSCEVTNNTITDKNNEVKNNIPVVDIEFLPGVKTEKEKYAALIDSQIRCDRILPKELSSKILFRIRDSYPLTECGKRDVNALKQEGFANTKKLIEVQGYYQIINGEAYVNPPLLYQNIELTKIVNTPGLIASVKNKKNIKRLILTQPPIK